MIRTAVVALLVSVGLALVPVVGAAEDPPSFEPGAPGLGDPYFPLDGNGGYDVESYRLDLTYDPSSNLLTGVATIHAHATQDLSRFNLDFDGLTVRSVKVNGRQAAWERHAGELTVTPSKGLRDWRGWTTEVRYAGRPRPIHDAFGLSGFLETDDGAVIVGEPHVASTWFPVNDHPRDKAAYEFRITVPKGLEAVANGTLAGQETSQGWTTWKWRAKEPMASYLATATVGDFHLSSYRKDGIRYWDAIDPALLEPLAVARTGSHFAVSRRGDLSYKRLARVIRIPRQGARLSFWVTRDTEAAWDFMFVEAQTVGRNDWTTLSDLNGHTSRDTGASCPYWLGLHPFLSHYQSAAPNGTCSPSGNTGKWRAISGRSDGWEKWEIDLSHYAGEHVRVSISYASDDSVQHHGVFIDDIVISSGPGSTSFEDDGNVRDRWHTPGAPKGSHANPNDWIVGTKKDVPPPLGETAQESFQRQGEIIRFLSDNFGPYPFSAAGGIVDDLEGLGFALENQTRPIYAKDFFYDERDADSVVVHELAHQWYGDNLAIAGWRHIWLNEGFASYAEWLWSEREGLGTTQEIFDSLYSIPANDSFWGLRIGNPGPTRIFDFPVYGRGAMTLHRLRITVGDQAFFTILRRWAVSRAGGNVTTSQFIELAERISGRQLQPLFKRWLFTPHKPRLPQSAGPNPRRATVVGQSQATMRHHVERLRGISRSTARP